MLPIIIQLISGAIGGNVAGKVMKNFDLGTLVNSVLGVVGGGLGGQLLALAGVAATTGGTDIASIVGSLASGGVGGGSLLAIVGLIKQAMAK